MQIKLVSLWIVSSHQSSVIYADIIRNLESTWSWLVLIWRSASHIGHSNKFQPTWPAAAHLVWVFIKHIYMLTGTAPLPSPTEYYNIWKTQVGIMKKQNE